MKTVYCAGYSKIGTNNPIATYWKNDTAFKLTDGTKQGIAKAVVVVAVDVYVAGSEINATGKKVAKYWKNGVATLLTKAGNGETGTVYSICMGN